MHHTKVLDRDVHAVTHDETKNFNNRRRQYLYPSPSSRMLVLLHSANSCVTTLNDRRTWAAHQDVRTWPVDTGATQNERTSAIFAIGSSSSPETPAGNSAICRPSTRRNACKCAMERSSAVTRRYEVSCPKSPSQLRNASVNTSPTAATRDVTTATPTPSGVEAVAAVAGRGADGAMLPFCPSMAAWSLACD